MKCWSRFAGKFIQIPTKPSKFELIRPCEFAWCVGPVAKTGTGKTAGFTLAMVQLLYWCCNIKNIYIRGCDSPNACDLLLKLLKVWIPVVHTKIRLCGFGGCENWDNWPIASRYDVLVSLQPVVDDLIIKAINFDISWKWLCLMKWFACGI